MKVLGLTGGIGMGKSACAGFLRAKSIPVVDTDDLARQIVEPGEPALAEIRSAFGPGVFDSEGRLRRGEMARLVFADSESRRKLESMLHPRIRARWRQQVEIWAREGASLAVVVIPLLYETGAEREFDATVCIACSRATQQSRLLERGWTEAQIEQRLAAQLPVEFKMAKADFVIWTEADLGLHAQQLDRILFRCKSQSLC
jgi:dephospho-CoA kinase